MLSGPVTRTARFSTSKSVLTTRPAGSVTCSVRPSASYAYVVVRALLPRIAVTDAVFCIPADWYATVLRCPSGSLTESTLPRRSYVYRVTEVSVCALSRSIVGP